MRIGTKILVSYIGVLLSVFLVGCASIPNTQSQASSSKKTRREDALLEKDKEIKKYQSLLLEKERQLKEKDLAIEEMKKELAAFGVFK